MNTQRRSLKNTKAILSFGCWDEIGDSFQLLVVSNEILIHSLTECIRLNISLELKVEIVKKQGLFIEIRMNECTYKASDNNIKQFSKLLASKVTFLNIKDNYQIVRQIGQGGQSEGVFEIQNIHTKEIKAMKKYLKSQQSITKIHKEIKITQKFQSRNVIKIDEVYESDNSIFIIYEKLAAFNFNNYNQEQKTQFIYDLLNIIQIMHASGYMHRDIKLSNIMVNSQNEIKLIDFGLATKCKKQHKQCGTPGHMAPEIFSTTSYNEKCDIYSLGVLIYEMFTDKQLFNGANKQDLKNKNQYGLFQTSKLEQLPQEFQNLIKEMLQMDPNYRISAQIAKLSQPFAKDLNDSFMTDATSMHQSKVQKEI